MGSLEFKALLGFGVVMAVIGAAFWLVQRRFPESESPNRSREDSLFRRYVAFEAAENGLLAIPFLVIGAAGIVVGSVGLLFVG
ncbi:MAG TPA: hypothetical protein VEV82_07445 [Actinomycetota bacterium]|nr:hypothetical protein [Actinomycetota bacterium]